MREIPIRIQCSRSSVQKILFEKYLASEQRRQSKSVLLMCRLVLYYQHHETENPEQVRRYMFSKCDPGFRVLEATRLFTMSQKSDIERHHHPPRVIFQQVQHVVIARQIREGGDLRRVCLQVCPNAYDVSSFEQFKATSIVPSCDRFCRRYATQARELQVHGAAKPGNFRVVTAWRCRVHLISSKIRPTLSRLDIFRFRVYCGPER